MIKIRLKAHNGQYVCAENGGGQEVIANRTKADIWETFLLHDQNNGRLESGNIVFLTANNGQYFCAENGGGQKLVANRTKPDVWESFKIEKVNGSGEIRNGDKVSFKACNNQYLCAEGGGGREIVVNRNSVGVWESFTIEIMADNITNSSSTKIITNNKRRKLAHKLGKITSKSADAVHINKLRNHLAILKSINVDDLGSLGKMELSQNIIPQRGISTTTLPQLYVGEIPFQNAYRIKAENSDVTFENISGTGRLLNKHNYSGTASIEQSYIFADEINIADGTIIILKNNIKSLVIVANKIKVGKNVTFTWERQIIAIPKKLDKLPKPPKQAALLVLNFERNYGRGIDGRVGSTGEPGYTPNFAPFVEIWALELEGNPSFDLSGQEGGQGGDGQDGQDGGDGADGRPEQYGRLGFVESGPGNGGNGGNGGKAGNGGIGGCGGKGGSLNLYIPQEAILRYVSDFYISVDGGDGGQGGSPGRPGACGRGGAVGRNKSNKEKRTGGANGQPGDIGLQGAKGSDGEHGEEHIISINEKDFNSVLNKPGIASLDKYAAKTGDTITVLGHRFNNSDQVLLGGNKCGTIFFDDNKLQFIVSENTAGGMCELYIQQIDGTQSNKLYIKVIPVVTEVISQHIGKGGIIPGKEAYVIGSGFSKDSRVLVNEVMMTDVSFINSNKLKFTLMRPSNVVPNVYGETVSVKVVQNDGQQSNSIDIMLDTFRMMVFGDSIAWGQGLRECDKAYALVEDAIRARYGNLGVYRMQQDMRAHSGAVIGIEIQDDGTSYHGEIPRSCPTILAQVEKYTERPETVDIILMDGGINDVNVRTILNPFTTSEELMELTKKYCKNHLSKLLSKVTSKYTNAKVIVTGYYEILSEKSDTDRFENFLIATGVLVGGLIGGVTALVLDKLAMNSIISNCKLFSELSSLYIREAAAEINKELGVERVYCVIPPFTADNAAFAANPFIYGINSDLSSQDDPTIAAERARAVELADLDWDEEAIAIRASCGHPNPAGARIYANEIIKYI